MAAIKVEAATNAAAAAAPVAASDIAASPPFLPAAGLQTGALDDAARPALDCPAPCDRFKVLDYFPRHQRPGMSVSFVLGLPEHLIALGYDLQLFLEIFIKHQWRPASEGPCTFPAGSVLIVKANLRNNIRIGPALLRLTVGGSKFASHISTPAVGFHVLESAGMAAAAAATSETDAMSKPDVTSSSAAAAAAGTAAAAVTTADAAIGVSSSTQCAAASTDWPINLVDHDIDMRQAAAFLTDNIQSGALQADVCGPETGAPDRVAQRILAEINKGALVKSVDGVFVFDTHNCVLVANSKISSPEADTTMFRAAPLHVQAYRLWRDASASLFDWSSLKRTAKCIYGFIGNCPPNGSFHCINPFHYEIQSVRWESESNCGADQQAGQQQAGQQQAGQQQLQPQKARPASGRAQPLKVRTEASSVSLTNGGGDGDADDDHDADDNNHDGGDAHETERRSGAASTGPTTTPSAAVAAAGTAAGTSSGGARVDDETPEIGREIAIVGPGGHSAAEYQWLCESHHPNALVGIDSMRCRPDALEIIKRILEKVKYGKLTEDLSSGEFGFQRKHCVLVACMRESRSTVRMDVANLATKCWPQALAYRLWRDPFFQLKEWQCLRKLPTCTFGYGGPKCGGSGGWKSESFICINPFHYEIYGSQPSTVERCDASVAATASDTAHLTKPLVVSVTAPSAAAATPTEPSSCSYGSGSGSGSGSGNGDGDGDGSGDGDGNGCSNSSTDIPGSSNQADQAVLHDTSLDLTDVLGPLIATAETVRFEPGDVIIDLNSSCKDMFILKRGRLALLTSDNVMLECLTAGNLFGEIGYFYDIPSLIAVKAMTRSKVIRLPHQVCRQVFQANLNAKQQVAMLAQQRLDVISNQRHQAAANGGSSAHYELTEHIAKAIRSLPSNSSSSAAVLARVRQLLSKSSPPAPEPPNLPVLVNTILHVNAAFKQDRGSWHVLPGKDIHSGSGGITDSVGGGGGSTSGMVTDSGGGSSYGYGSSRGKFAVSNAGHQSSAYGSGYHGNSEVADSGAKDSAVSSEGHKRKSKGSSGNGSSIGCEQQYQGGHVGGMPPLFGGSNKRLRTNQFNANATANTAANTFGQPASLGASVTPDQNLCNAWLAAPGPFGNNVNTQSNLLGLLMNPGLLQQQLMQAGGVGYPPTQAQLLQLQQYQLQQQLLQLQLLQHHQQQQQQQQQQQRQQLQQQQQQQ